MLGAAGDPQMYLGIRGYLCGKRRIQMKEERLRELEELHYRVVYPTVLVRTSKSGGSGTMIYSKPHPDGDGYLSYCLTNNHVIEEAITFTKNYDSLVGRELPKPLKEIVNISFYRYRDLSRLQAVEGYQADIVAWDTGADLALLELRGRMHVEYIATLFPQYGKKLYMLQPVTAVGCSLGHKPLPSDGKISSLDEQMENRPRFMSSACIIYGNSGGALYTDWEKELVGVPCAGDVIITGFYNAQAIPHLGYVIPYWAIYDFLREKCYDFIFDDSKTYQECEEARKEKMDALQLAEEERWKRDQARGH